MQDLGLEVAKLPTNSAQRLPLEELLPNGKIDQTKSGNATPHPAEEAATQSERPSADTQPVESDAALQNTKSADSSLVVNPGEAGLLQRGEIAEKDTEEKQVKAVGPGVRHLVDEEEGDALDMGNGKEKPVEDSTPKEVIKLVAKMPDEEAELLKRQWDGLRAAIESLHPVENFSVASISYRRCMQCTPLFHT